MAKLLKTPIYSRGTYKKLQEALAEGGVFYNIDRIVWHYCTDTDGDYAGNLILVDVEKNLTPMVGHNNDEIQELIDRITEVAQQASDLGTDLEDIKTQLEDIYTKEEVDELIVQTTSYSKEEIDEMMENVDNQITSIDEKVDEILTWTEV